MKRSLLYQREKQRKKNKEGWESEGKGNWRRGKEKRRAARDQSDRGVEVKKWSVCVGHVTFPLSLTLSNTGI